jgi:pimeloyl-ACP methyl ester carboxylesterase
MARLARPAAAALQPARLQVGEASIYHYDVGQGPVVVLLHGFNHHAEAWIRNIAALAQAGFRVLALDLPGFGRSGMPPMSYSLRGYSEFLRDFLAAAGAERAHLVGNSMGGAIALRFAIDHPAQVLSITAVDTAGMFARVPRVWAWAATPLARLVMRPFMGHPRLIQWSHQRAYFDSTIPTPGQTDIMAEAYTQPGYKDHILRMAETMLVANDGVLWDGVARLQMPVLVVWGRQDTTLPVQHAYRAAHRIPGSEVVIYDRCGHLPMYEKADDFNRDLIDFLGRSSN